MVALPNRKQPPEWLPRAVVMILAILAAAAVVFWIVNQLRGLIYILFLSLFVAIAFEPAVQALVKRGWKRGLATSFVFVVGGLALFGFLSALVPVLVGQASQLIDDLPEYLEGISGFLANLGVNVENLESMIDFENLGELVRQYGSEFAGGVLAVGNTVFALIFQLATVVLFAYYLLAEGPTWRRALLSTLNPKRQETVLHTWETAVEKTGRYVYSRAILAIVAIVFTWIVLLLLRVPSPFPLAVWMGVISQFIPVIGTYIGMVLPALAGLSVSPLTAVWVIVAMVVYQQLENYLIAPRITSRTMDIHPAVSIGAVIAGASLLGGVGAILALPLTAIIQALVSDVLARHEVIDSDLIEDEPQST